MGNSFDACIMMTVIMTVVVRLISYQACIIVVASLAFPMTGWLKQVQAVFLKYKNFSISKV
jgi:hypothetical protein